MSTAEQFAERRLPTVAELNAAAPDTPVSVLHLDQTTIMNGSAVRAAGITPDTPDPTGGQFVRDRTGAPTDVLLAAPSALILYSVLAKAPTLSAEERGGSTRHFLREPNRFGLTTAIDAAGGFQRFPDDYATVAELAREGRLTLRIAYHLFPRRAGQELDDLRRQGVLAHLFARGRAARTAPLAALPLLIVSLTAVVIGLANSQAVAFAAGLVFMGGLEALRATVQPDYHAAAVTTNFTAVQAGLAIPVLVIGALSGPLGTVAATATVITPTGLIAVVALARTMNRLPMSPRSQS